MNEIGYQYWLKCRPERPTFSSIGQDSISLTPAIQQGVAAWWCRRQRFDIDRQGQSYTFLNVGELMKCILEDNSVYVQRYINCPRLTRAGAIPQRHSGGSMGATGANAPPLHFKFILCYKSHFKFIFCYKSPLFR